MPRVPMSGAVAGVAGQGLKVLFRGAGMLRVGPKALHPRGRTGSATLRISGDDVPLGVPLLDVAAEHPCLVRLSRATGLPRRLPDVLGLALRVEADPDAACDLLFASTGMGRLGRHLLVPRREHAHSTLTTLLPVRAAGGALLLALVPTGPASYALRSAPPGADWVTRGVLLIGELGPDDRSVRFDPVGRTPAGLDQYDVVRRLRGPAYSDR